MKRTALIRRKQLRRRPPQSPVAERAARMEWKTPRAGFCGCGCDRFSMRLERHHIVYEQEVRREGGDPWDIANSLLLSPVCHRYHHDAFRRVSLDAVPAAALEFAIDLLGEDRAALYLARRYGSARAAA